MNLVQLLYLASLQLNYNVQVLILLYSNFIFFTSYFGFIYGHVSPLMFFLQNRGKGYELQPSQICIYYHVLLFMLQVVLNTLSMHFQR
jgi:hypothetical protein